MGRMMLREAFTLITQFCLTATLFCQIALAADEPSPREIAAKKFPREQWGAALVDVSHDADKRAWIIQGQKHTVRLNERDLSLKIQAGATVWSMVPSTDGDMIVKAGAHETAVRLADAGHIDIVPYDAAFKTGVKVTL